MNRAREVSHLGILASRAAGRRDCVIGKVKLKADRQALARRIEARLEERAVLRVRLTVNRQCERRVEVVRPVHTATVAEIVHLGESLDNLCVCHTDALNIARADLNRRLGHADRANVEHVGVEVEAVPARNGVAERVSQLSLVAHATEDRLDRARADREGDNLRRRGVVRGGERIHKVVVRRAVELNNAISSVHGHESRLERLIELDRGGDVFDILDLEGHVRIRDSSGRRGTVAARTDCQRRDRVVQRQLQGKARAFKGQQLRSGGKYNTVRSMVQQRGLSVIIHSPECIACWRARPTAA